MSKFYSFYPPYLYLVQMLEHCPEAGSTYLMIWREMNAQHHKSYTKKEIVDSKCIPWKKFKNDLRLLVKEGLIEFALNDDESLVEITCAELDEADDFLAGKITC